MQASRKKNYRYMIWTHTLTYVAQTVHFDSDMIARAPPILNAQTKVHLALAYVQWQRAFSFPLHPSYHSTLITCWLV